MRRETVKLINITCRISLIFFMSGMILYCKDNIAENSVSNIGKMMSMSTVRAEEKDGNDTESSADNEEESLTSNPDDSETEYESKEGTDQQVNNGPVSESETETESDPDGGHSDSICVVIDPGHGGENLGGEYEEYVEKEMTLIVAKAMKEELEKYEGVTVYMTRTADQELSLEERCDYAKSVDADFLFCLHFNMSEHHTLFGAECWVSAFGENYSKGYAFASVEMDMLQELGLYSRGIKTRLNNRGGDYYGIIRRSVEKEIPCVIIEHCHLDQKNDIAFYDHDEKLKDFGRLDATAVARYFNLKSEALGVDYSNYQNLTVEIPDGVMAPDQSEPEYCMIEVLDQNADNGEVTVQVSAADYDSGMLYYTYSYDDGEHFSELQRWPDRSSDTFSFVMKVPSRVIPRIVINGYNGYDLCTTSNVISLPAMDYKTPEQIAAELAAKDVVESISKAVNSKRDIAEKMAAENKNIDEAPEADSFLIIVCVVCALLVLVMVISMALIVCSRRNRRRRRKARKRADH